MRERVIVIAERDTNIRHLAARTLRRHGYAVVEAATAKAALAAIRQSSPGLLILDLSLPPTGGASVAEALRGDPATAALSVLVLVTKKQEADVASWLASHLYGNLIKPFAPRDLLARVEPILTLRADR